MNRYQFDMPAEERLDDSSTYLTFTFQVEYRVHPEGEVSVLKWELWEVVSWIGDVASEPQLVFDEAFQGAAKARLGGWLKRGGNLSKLEGLCFAEWETEQQIAREAWA